MEATAVSALPDFGQQHFGAANLGHKKRNACLVRIANALMRHPGGTLPNKRQSPAEYKAMIGLANRRETTHQAVLQPHLDRTFAPLGQLEGVGLLIHDGTELDYSGLHSITTLGPIGNGHNRGYLCHNSLAIDPGSRTMLGLAGQILHTRVPVPKGEGVKAKRERASRESRLWTRAIEVMPTAPAGKLWVDIADRGADLFEFLANEAAHDRSYVVRACFSRKIGIGHGTEPKPAALHAYARSLVPSGRRQITVSDGKGGQRKATVAMSFAAVQLLPPHVKRGLYESRPLLVWVIRVWEIDAPAGVTPVEWILLTNVAVTTATQAWERVSWYECRWLVELTIDELKTHQQERPVLRSQTPAGVIQEIEGLLLAHYAVRTLMFEAASEQGVDPRRLSFTATLKILRRRLAEVPKNPKDKAGSKRWWEDLVAEVGEEVLPPRRDRINPRVIRQKMSKWAKKRPSHRRPPQPTKSFRDSIVIT